MRGVKVPKNTHKFYGYWPPESHLVEFIREEIMKGPYLKGIWDANCRGHSIEDIIEAIEQQIPPEAGVPIKVLWNPGVKITPYLFSETPAQRAQARMELQQDLRTVVINDKEQIKLSILYLLNNTAQKQPSLSMPGEAVRAFDTPYAAQPWTPQHAAERAAQIDAANRRIWEQFVLAASGGKPQ